MSVQVKRRRESAAFLAGFVGAQGELLIDTTCNRIQVHDGATPGGFPAAKLADLALLAPLASPALTGNPTAPTPNPGDATAKLATTAFVAAAIVPAGLTTLAQGASGTTIQVGVLEQLVTLAGASTASTVQIPNRAIVLAVSSRTVTAVAGAPSYGVGVAGNATQFGGGLGTSAGSTNIGVIGPTAFYAATPVVVTATSGSFTAGQVRIAIQYLVFGAPSV
jgi:hypothetical protein